jgi:hypothetical protein
MRRAMGPLLAMLSIFPIFGILDEAERGRFPE